MGGLAPSRDGARMKLIAALIRYAKNGQTILFGSDSGTEAGLLRIGRHHRVI